MEDQDDRSRREVRTRPAHARPIRSASTCYPLAALLLLSIGSIFSCSGARSDQGGPPFDEPLACDAGGCQQSCTGKANCEIDCKGGNCRQSCDGSYAVSHGGALPECHLSCDGGNCQQSCLGAGMKLDCVMDCKGGGCVQDCNGGDNCNVGCDGGGCTCTGFDCPAPRCPSTPYIPLCCSDGALTCPWGRSCLSLLDIGEWNARCCADDPTCQPTESCWKDPATATSFGVCVPQNLPVGRCCLGSKAYSCSTKSGYARCAGVDLKACRALCAPKDCACQADCASAAAASPGGDPSECSAQPSDDRLCAPPAGCAGQSDGTPCACDTDCATGNCQEGRCFARTSGNPCTNSSECDSGNCFANCCTSNTEGSSCSEDANCASNNCNHGTEWDDCGRVVCAGVCGSNTSAAPCAIDAECQSGRCLIDGSGDFASGQCL